MARRATVASYLELGPITADEIEHAAKELREAGVSLLRRGYEFAADQAWNTAERFDETAFLARVVPSVLIGAEHGPPAPRYSTTLTALDARVATA